MRAMAGLYRISDSMAPDEGGGGFPNRRVWRVYPTYTTVQKTREIAAFGKSMRWGLGGLFAT